MPYCRKQQRACWSCHICFWVSAGGCRAKLQLKLIRRLQNMSCFLTSWYPTRPCLGSAPLLMANCLRFLHQALAGSVTLEIIFKRLLSYGSLSAAQDTIVWDPFFTKAPEFLQMSLKELFGIKHPKSWIRFERGEIDEGQLFDQFFTDGRSFDGLGLKQAMVSQVLVVPVGARAKTTVQVPTGTCLYLKPTSSKLPSSIVLAGHTITPGGEVEQTDPYFCKLLAILLLLIGLNDGADAGIQLQIYRWHGAAACTNTRNEDTHVYHEQLSCLVSPYRCASGPVSIFALAIPLM